MICRNSCNARIGLMGNPSDGFNGKTLSFLIKNFNATVTIEQQEKDSNDASKIEIIPHAIYDRTSYGNINELISTININGYYGGTRLIQATCKIFFKLCSQAMCDIDRNRGWKLSYDTTIPRCVGLSGSSAIIIATFRSLLLFYNLSIQDLHVVQEQFPQLILDIEKNELDISAGLQDRVIQVYEGLIHMDFSNPNTPSSSSCTNSNASSSNNNIYGSAEYALGKYTSLDPSSLPPMYLAYNTVFGGDSGKVHSTVKERWIRQEPELIEGMNTLGRYADEACICLHKKDYSQLAILIEKNFAMRRKLYGDDVVGVNNIAVVDLLKTYDLAAKFTGSGGAILSCRADGIAELLSIKVYDKIRHELSLKGYEFIAIDI